MVKTAAHDHHMATRQFDSEMIEKFHNPRWRTCNGGGLAHHEAAEEFRGGVRQHLWLAELLQGQMSSRGARGTGIEE